jgi:hypothetical protein|tara:strand:- start:860 stop:1135 length:276 start_codon:yes stop_codon:yes gene_type:complete
MGQYDSKVEKQRLILEAEKWSKTVKSIHVHGCTSMWYETEESAKEIEENGHVTDTEYNSSIVTRHRYGKLVHTFGEELTGEDLLDSYHRHT